MKSYITKIILFAFLIVTIQTNAQTGNIGIGTSTPSEKLEVNGDIKSTNFSTVWKPSIAYPIDHVVIYEGQLFKHLTTSNTTTSPDQDATNWESINSNAALTTTTETLTITSTGTNPIKATTPINDYITATDDGTWVTINFDYSHANNTGATIGTGDYLFKLPAGYSFDLATHPINTQNDILIGSGEAQKMIHFSGLILADTIYSFRNYIVPYDATHFRIVTIDVNQWSFVGEGHFVLSHTNTSYKGSFTFKKS